ncbi:CoA transferase [Alicyclobacillus fastidiosus]|uniref:CoA transferase n=1 Tax=Alicyclobacillus fastidiosus TaxID=392011 RepID=A0ABY6ZR17_9BACL|nr:CaiB/BaiF CoA-transferase family protein [Alicyclobacillus fastidiosus]WAH44405.1 CoA transferase [Alicyclobacillus fastidiosus]GMA60745.1 CoA transferase [Alicyclobacillus fastidiosus]
MKPLEGLLVLDFSQFLSGPSAALRLADMGARVIKVERPGIGDGCRALSLGVDLDGDSLLFHTINRNKESYTADLKEKSDLQNIMKLVGSADVLIENFRPGVMEKLGLGYESVCEINPKLVYGRITGYGVSGPWKEKPGQDLLVQAISGLTWLNGDAAQPPMPFGLAVADMLTGAYLTQGILACLVRRSVKGIGGLVEVSLLESIMDFQFEVFTTYLNGGPAPRRSEINSAHAYLGAPYGIYETKDGYLALAMGSVPRLGELLGCSALNEYQDKHTWITKRDEIKSILVSHLKTRTTQEWLSILEPADYWCSDVYTWQQLLNHDGFKALNLVQDLELPNGELLKTTRCPVRVDGEILTSTKCAPALGVHTELINSQFNI